MAFRSALYSNYDQNKVLNLFNLQEKMYAQLSSLNKNPQNTTSCVVSLEFLQAKALVPLWKMQNLISAIQFPIPRKCGLEYVLLKGLK